MRAVNVQERQLGRRLPLASALTLCAVALATCDSATPAQELVEPPEEEAEVVLSDVPEVPLTVEATRRAAQEILASRDRLYPTSDERLAEVALAVPGYAGHYLGVEENLHAEQDLHVLYTSHEGPSRRGGRCVPRCAARAVG